MVDCFKNLLKPSMVFSTVSENIYIFLITPGLLKIDKFLKTEYKVIYLKITEAATGDVF